MSVEDFRINASVRQVLCRNWVDLQALNYGAAGRIVYFTGTFQKVRPPRRPEDDPWETSRQQTLSETLSLLEDVERQLRRDPNVVDVVFRLENFRKIRGKWEGAGV
ncbi:MAG TPA: hypothetical protein VKU85_16945 [bacterium]|nr:hypothetical protein [bacterium]